MNMLLGQYRSATCHATPRKTFGLAYMLIFAACTSVFSAYSFAESRCDQWAAKLESVEGKVLWKDAQNDHWQPAALGFLFCYGDTIKIKEYRAAIRLSNQTVVRLKENSTLILKPEDASFWVKMIEGAGHFLTRTPKKFVVEGPQLNASVDGTEFTVSAESEEHTVSVFEGQVTANNSAGAIQLTSGQQTQSSNATNAPSKAINVRLQDAVTWTLHFPPVVTTKNNSALPAKFHSQIQNGDYKSAFEYLRTLKVVDEDPDIAALRASLELFYGNSEAATRLIDNSLRLSSSHPESLALQSLLSLIKGEPEKALRTSQNLATSYPDNATVQLVLSYAEQANFSLDSALTHAQKANELDNGNGIILSRSAELALNSGDTKLAERYADEALQAAPKLSRAHTIRGFIALKQLKIKKARQLFDKAIALDSSDPLAHFAYGLTRIRQGELIEGREKIELAIILDPANSLYRSYLGKAYFEEKRFDMADTQFELAQQLDQNDPTPDFYQAIQYQRLNQPQKALEKMQESIVKNDNRAVYRSRLMLDSDSAARNASLSNIYLDLGLDEQAKTVATRTLAADPTNHSAHLLLAQTLAKDPLADTARASEILQAQLLQPADAKPIPALGAETNLFVLDGTGPQDMGINEYNSLFNTEDAELNASIIRGSENTRASNIALRGLEGPVSYALENYHYETDGFWENGDAYYNISNVFVQSKVTDGIKLYVEHNSRAEKRGDFAIKLRPDSAYDNQRTNIKSKRTRLGANINVSPRTQILTTVDYAERTPFTSSSTSIQESPFAPVIDIESSAAGKDFFNEIETLALFSFDNFQTSLGGVYTDINRREDFCAITTLQFPLPPNAPPGIPSPPPQIMENCSESSGNSKYRSLYNYWTWSPSEIIRSSIGASYIELEDLVSLNTKTSSINPKLTINVDSSSLTASISAFKDVARFFTPTNQNLETTSLSKTTIIRDYPLGAEVESISLSLEKQNTSSGVNYGINSYSDRITLNLNSQLGVFTNQQKIKTDLAQLYIRYNIWNGLHAAIQPTYSTTESPKLISSNGTTLETSFPLQIETLEIPIALKYKTKMVSFELTVTNVNQKTLFDNLQGAETTQLDDQFLSTDISIKYTLPKSLGTLSIEGRNILGENFFMQDDKYWDSSRQILRYSPERLFFLKLQSNL